MAAGAQESSQGAPADSERIDAVLSLWEYGYQEFNQLVRLPRSDIGRFQDLLRSAATEPVRRGLAVLLALNCSLPGKHEVMTPLQKYRCGGMQYSRFERWATSSSGDIYLLAFANTADQSAAIRALKAKLAAARAQPVEDVAGKELISELVGYLEAGGLR